MDPTYHAIFILTVPFLSAGLIALFFRKHGNIAAGISITAAAVILVSSLALVFGGKRPDATWVWLELGDYTLSLGIYFNDLAALMLFVVAFVGFFIHIFSLEYMRGDPGKARYFAGLSLFMFSMCGVVFADNLMLIFIFWELVGVSSFLLINHWFHKKSAAEASKKAFIVNRVGDFGFLVGIIWCYWHFGTLSLIELSELIALDPDRLHVGLGLLLFCAALGKSGQIPLHVWLPDAMEGPTPVSALIHAATMVAAGIYLLTRIYFMMLPEVLTVVLIIGTATALMGALTAIVQTDIKKILAYSTISQLGFMVAAFGLGALNNDAAAGAAVPLVLAGGAAAMFHLTTHAFFKALLFLGAGSIIHACHHEQNIYRMGGLAKRMPVTFVCFTVGFLALIGFPGLAGFFSKDAILYLAMEKNMLVFVILAFTSLLTAFYMSRLWLTVFFGRAKTDMADVAKENNLIITGPLIVLAIGSIVAGWTFLHPVAFSGVIDRIPHPTGAAHWIIVGISIAAVLIGFGGAWKLYGVGAAEDRFAKSASPALLAPLRAKFGFDDLYQWYVANVQQRVAAILSFLDQVLIAGVIVRGAAGLAAIVGLGARAGHTGSLHAYVYWFFAGVVLLIAVATGLF